MNKSLILFDLDGVLLDSRENMELSWLAVQKRYDIDIEFESYFSKIGRPFENILDLLNIRENKKEIETVFNQTSVRLIHKLNFYDGVDAVLRHISDSGIKTGIVTSKNTSKTKTILDLLNFKFDIVQTPNDELQGKPAPDHILHAMSELGVAAESTLYIGDMDVDCEAAKRAGVDYIHADWGYGVCNDEDTIKLEKIMYLMDVVK